MRRTTTRLLLLFAAALATGSRAARAEPKTVRSEALGFEISTPDSEDWESRPIDEAARPELKALFVTEYADSSPPAGSEVELQVMAWSPGATPIPLAQQVANWKPTLEAHLENPRERTEGAVEVAGVEGYRVDVKWEDPAGVRRLTYYLARNGKHQYLLLVRRRYAAVGDEYLDKEIRQIVDSFRFLGTSKPEDGPPPGDGAKPEGQPQGEPAEDIDPERLAAEDIEIAFWRFRCVKPEGLLKLEPSAQEAAQGVKLKFQNDRDGARLMIRVYADTARNDRYTLDDLPERRIREFKELEKMTRTLEPKIDRRFEFPLAEKAIRLELVGRSSVRVERVWIFAVCRNDRNYQLEIYVSGTNGDAVWGRTVERFLSGFQPYMPRD